MFRKPAVEVEGEEKTERGLNVKEVRRRMGKTTGREDLHVNVT